MADKVTIGGITVERGTKGFGKLTLCTMADGNDLSIPVHIIAGSKPGPRVTVLSTQHGYEVFPISIIRELVMNLNPKEISGDLVLVPVANPIAFAAGTRCTWVDSIMGDSGNMNRLWPGKPDGWLTERMTNMMTKQLIDGSDCVIDLHNGTIAQPQLDLYYGYCFQVEGEFSKRVEKVATSFGIEILMSRVAIPGTLLDYALKLGIPTFGGEMGTFWGLDVDRTNCACNKPLRTCPEVGVTGVTNVMKVLGMMSGEPVLPKHQVRVSPELNLRPSHGGLLISEATNQDIGRVLPKGTVLGRVISPYTFEELDVITAPFDENLLIAATGTKPFCKVNAGDFGYLVADWKTVEWLRR